MTLTEEQIQSNLAAYEHAMRAGDNTDIEAYRQNAWHGIIGPFYVNGIYRIRPTPRLRPWKLEEMPVGAMIRHKKDRAFRSIITSVNRFEICIARTWIDYSQLNDDYEHSTDGGKTWLPCGVMEEGE